MMCGLVIKTIFLILIFCDYNYTKIDLVIANGGVKWTFVLLKFHFLGKTFNELKLIIWVTKDFYLFFEFQFILIVQQT